ncbi:RICIN domain-containing protein [Streptomyces roseifaciens]
MFTHTVRTRQSTKATKAKLVLSGAAAASALLAGLAPVPAGAASATSTTTVAQDSQHQVAAAKMFRIQNYQTKACIYRVSDTRVSTKRCDAGDTSQRWVRGADDSISNLQGTACLGDVNTNVGMFPCGLNEMRWTRYSEGYVKNWATKKCLGMLQVSGADFVFSDECNHTELQKWAFKN